MTISLSSVPRFHKVQEADRLSSNMWLRNLASIPTSHTLARIRSHLVANTLWAMSLFVMMHYYPAAVKILTTGMTSVPHSLSGGALGLLLVFRTNSAYDRFWESRKIWSAMITHLRELARLSHSSLRGWDREHVLQLLAAFPPVLLQHLRSGRGRGSGKQREALKGLLSESDVDRIWASRHRPMCVLRMISAIVRSAFTDIPKLARRFGDTDPRGTKFSPFEISIIKAEVGRTVDSSERNIAALVSSVSAAERIVKTAIPKSYSKHTSRFLSVWLFSLPLVLLEQMSWRCVPAVAAITWGLLSIEEVGNMVEDPFNAPTPPGRGKHSSENETPLERSFVNIRGDIMDRSPADDGMLYCEREDVKGSGFSFQEQMCFTEYSMDAFHTIARASFSSGGAELSRFEKEKKAKEKEIAADAMLYVEDGELFTEETSSVSPAEASFSEEPSPPAKKGDLPPREVMALEPFSETELEPFSKTEQVPTPASAGSATNLKDLTDGALAEALEPFAAKNGDLPWRYSRPRLPKNIAEAEPPSGSV